MRYCVNGSPKILLATTSFVTTFSVNQKQNSNVFLVLTFDSSFSILFYPYYVWVIVL